VSDLYCLLLNSQACVYIFTLLQLHLNLTSTISQYSDHTII